MKNPPIVMTFSGHDPSGGAGIQADIETLASQGCLAATVITALTVQDSRDVIEFEAVDASHVITQARAVLEDMPVAAFKIGMIGSVENAQAIHSILNDYLDIPLVLDPVLAAGGGTSLGDEQLLESIKVLLVPRTSVLTPNSVEARLLAPEADTLDACAFALLDRGADYVLVTGTHENTPHVVNALYHAHRLLESFTWERLPHSYHGSGCTLAACTAGMMAHGLEPFHAVHEAQEFTWNALKNGFRPGMGQYFPDRLFWSRQDDQV
ncbi:MAG: hydroxymethylpyrimidine/phosphomethylpyrimidine kinase [Gammaproteobacteria bacterium]